MRQTAARRVLAACNARASKQFVCVCALAAAGVKPGGYGYGGPPAGGYAGQPAGYGVQPPGMMPPTGPSGMPPQAGYHPQQHMQRGGRGPPPQQGGYPQQRR